MEILWGALGVLWGTSGVLWGSSGILWGSAGDLLGYHGGPQASSGELVEGRRGAVGRPSRVEGAMGPSFGVLWGSSGVFCESSGVLQGSFRVRQGSFRDPLGVFWESSGCPLGIIWDPLMTPHPGALPRARRGSFWDLQNRSLLCHLRCFMGPDMPKGCPLSGGGGGPRRLFFDPKISYDL